MESGIRLRRSHFHLDHSLPWKERVVLLGCVGHGPARAEVNYHCAIPRRREVAHQAATALAELRRGGPQALRDLRNRPIEHSQHLHPQSDAHSSVSLCASVCRNEKELK